ncbi:hypothetical protein T4B_4023 [Trichinella pseudospiralis]|uniref:Uncharacterized protein n=2 Tax=Trichinella pseudospiralis TaxID=6337 RepID=A0A0V1K301_TRIPS|nr:hypothetical protein T4D_14335 [Trichinella pseudospiralis]KRZ07581.1 hypothetical protein T4B_4023 [Trichinella pseudospiralis]KRZ41494.1 hypothetical protein T4C_4086 [Trichinella pseudospiralis]
MSRVDPGEKSSRRTASVINKRAQAAWCEGDTLLTNKKSSTASSQSVGSISRDNKQFRLLSAPVPGQAPNVAQAGSFNSSTTLLVVAK